MNTFAQTPLESSAPRLASVATSLLRISWGAVFAGMVIAVVLQLVLSLIGAGIGLSTLDPLRANGSPDAATFGIGAAVWWALTSVIALFAAGWVAGHLAGVPEKADAMLHGLLVWGLATIVTVYLLASVIGSVFSAGASAVGTAARATATGAAALAGPLADMAENQLEASGITLDDIEAQGRELLAQTGVPALQPGALSDQASAAAARLSSTAANAGSDGQPAMQDLESALQKIIQAGKNTVDQVDRNALVNVVMARAAVSRSEAEQRVDGWVKSYENARAELAQRKEQAIAMATQAADSTARASSRIALWSAVALILGAIAATLGGLAAARRRSVVATEMSRAGAN